MATVYLGRAMGEGGFERLVAIKVMHEHVAEDADFRSMFLDEARLAARIRHPNVVAVIDIQRTEQDQLFLVMDFVDGPSLHQLRKRLSELGRKLPLDVTMRIFIDALSGLHAAHELTGPDGALLNLVHRDVSPQNILVGKDGITRITDFGVARAEARITSTRGGQLKGKLSYMSPEQLRNEELDRRADVYGAGVALWEALTGKRLFDAGSEAGLVHMILGGVTQTPADVDPSVPAEISDLCMQALQAFKEDRPESAAAFADGLEAAAKKAGVEVASTRGLVSFLASLPKNVSSRPGALTGSQALANKPEAAPDPARAERATVPEFQRPAVGGELTSTSSVITATGTVDIPKHSRAPLVLGAVALVAGLTVGGYFLLRGSPEAGQAAPSAAATGSTAASAPATQTAAAIATVVPTPAPSSADTSSAAALPTAPASASAAASAAPVSGPARPGLARPSAQPRATAPVGVGYDPKGL